MPSLDIGTVVNGRYRLVRAVHSGDAVSRWIGEDTTLRRTVELWITERGHRLGAAAQDAARRAALVEDARLPHVLDIGREGELEWIITQHDDRAETLAELVAGGPLVAEDARALVGEAAQALELARRHGVHHEALTPECLQRDATGGVLVQGLGIAAAASGRESGEASLAAARDTRDLVALLRTALTGEWTGELPSEVPTADRAEGRIGAPSARVGQLPRVLDELCAQLDHDDPLALDGVELRTPGDLVRVLAPWDTSALTPGPLRRPGRRVGAAPGADGAPTTAVPVADGAAASVQQSPEDAATLALRRQEADDAHASAIPTTSIAAAGLGAGAGAAVAGTDALGTTDGTGPEASTGTAAGTREGTASEHGDGAGPVDSLDEGTRADDAEDRGRKGLVVAGVVALAGAGVLGLAAAALPGLFGGGADGDPAAAPESSVSSSVGDPGGNPDSTDSTDPAEDTPSTGGESPSNPQPSPSDVDESTEPQDDSAPSTDDGSSPEQDEASGEDDPQGEDTPSAEPSPDDDTDDTDATDDTHDDTPDEDTPDEEADQGEDADEGDDAPARTSPEGGWPISRIESYDPDHDGEEHDEWLGRINNPSTDLPWATHQYKHRPFGGYTQALGVRVDLGEIRDISSVDIGMPQGSWSYDVKAGPSRDISRAVTIGSRHGGGDHTFTADEPVQGRYVFVWFTDTAPTGDGWWYAQLEDVTVH